MLDPTSVLVAKFQDSWQHLKQRAGPNVRTHCHISGLVATFEIIESLIENLIDILVKKPRMVSEHHVPKHSLYGFLYVCYMILYVFYMILYVFISFFDNGH